MTGTDLVESEKTPPVSDKKKRCPIRFSKSDDGGFSVDGCASGFRETFGTDEAELIGSLMALSANASPTGSRAAKMNCAAQSLWEGKPQSLTEAKLISQASLLYEQGMYLIASANNESMIPQQEHCLKNAFKCLRLHNETVLALDKLRRGSDQKITVQHQHVNVEGGGRAIVNNGNMASSREGV